MLAIDRGRKAKHGHYYRPSENEAKLGALERWDGVDCDNVARDSLGEGEKSVEASCCTRPAQGIGNSEGDEDEASVDVPAIQHRIQKVEMRDVRHLRVEVGDVMGRLVMRKRWCQVEAPA